MFIYSWFQLEDASHEKFARRLAHLVACHAMYVILRSEPRTIIFVSPAGRDERSEFFVLCGANKTMHTVYVLENQDDKSWYIGQTDNLKRRVREHNSKQGGRTTKIRSGEWRLIYAEAYIDKRDALGREKFLKGGSGRKYLNKQLTYYLSL